jgi:hypothetical protein
VLTRAHPGALTDQLTDDVTFDCEPFVNVAVAVSCTVAPPVTTVPAAGVTLMEAIAGGVTVSVAEPLTVPMVADMLAVPALLAVTKPVFDTEAEAESELHVAVFVTLTDWPLE